MTAKSKPQDSPTLLQIREYVNNNTFTLPSVQRGFVWKPSQIENLWDSLLRGYPIGSFVLTLNADINNQYHILDGQQRISSICLGFNNPLITKNAINNEILKTSSQNYMVFVDRLRPESTIDNRQYLIRVITKSHPWGYSRKDNQKTLTSKDIGKALALYGIKHNYGYLKKPLIDFWPYDSFDPIPMGLINQAKNPNELESLINTWKKRIRYKANLNLNSENNSTEDPAKAPYSYKQIYSTFHTMLKEQRFPILYLNLNRVYANTNAISDSNSQGVEEEDEIENLFVRLNSGGTPLGGEELNYSLLKSKIDSELIKLIESKCKGLFNPSRFITIVFRLYNNTPLDKAKYKKGTNNNKLVNERDSIQMKIKPKQFQARIKTDIIPFQIFLENLLNSNTLSNIRKLLIYNKKQNSNGLPKSIVQELSAKAPEVMFMLLYRLHVKKDKINNALKQRLLGMVTLFIWFGRGVKLKNHSNLLRNIWPSVKSANTQEFWSSSTVERAKMQDNNHDVLLPIPTIREIRNHLKERVKYISNLEREKFVDNPEYGSFIDSAFDNKGLLLYTQRSALFEWFKDIEDHDLDDTNRAFDWDHICPSNFVKYRGGIHPALTSWFNSIGNLRAWPYSLNRSDQDEAPSDKLNPISEEILKQWKSDKIKYGYPDNSLRTYLTKRSFCEKDWLEISDSFKRNIKDNKTAKQITLTILNRNLKIFENWYKELQINELIVNQTSSKDRNALFRKPLKPNQWKDGVDTDDKEWYTYKTMLNENLGFIYFSYKIKSNILGNNEIQIGIVDSHSSGILDNLRIPKRIASRYILDDGCLYSFLTLRSYTNNAVKDLLTEVYCWINEIPHTPSISKTACSKLCQSVKIKLNRE